MNFKKRLKTRVSNLAANFERENIGLEQGKALPIWLPIEYARLAMSIRASVPEVNAIIDVGAHQGMFVSAVCWAFGETPNICFEPNMAFHSVLSDRCGPRGRVSDLGIGGIAGRQAFIKHQDSTMSSLVEVNDSVLAEKFPWDSPTTLERSEIDVITLDGIPRRFSDIPEHDLLLKLDTQGNELDILKSGGEFLQRVSACVVEHMFVDAYQSTYGFADLVTFMSRSGFKCGGALTISHRPSREVSSVDFLFLRSEATVATP